MHEEYHNKSKREITELNLFLTDMFWPAILFGMIGSYAYVEHKYEDAMNRNWSAISQAEEQIKFEDERK